VRFTHLARKAARILTAGLTAAVLTIAPGAGPALALTAAPRTTAPEFNGSVFAVAYRGSTVYVGGSFTTATSGGRTYSRERLAAFDGRTGALLSWAPAANNTVRALAVTGDSVYAAGDFGAVSGWRRDSLARIDALSGGVGSFAHSLSGAPYALAVGNGRLYLAGSFTAVDGSRRRELAAFSLITGGLDAYWRPSADDAVHAVSSYGGRVYLGGLFRTMNGLATVPYLAAVSGITGAVDRGFLPRTDAEVNSIAVDGRGIYIATGGQGGRAVAYGTTGLRRWQRVFDGDAATITTLNGVIYVGGHFDRACMTTNNGLHGTCSDASLPRVKLAAVTSSGELSTWAPQANGVIGVRVLSANPALRSISAGGDFTMIAGRLRHRFATFG
jgi:hypothetical protein